MFATLEGSSVLWCLLDDEEGKSGLGKPLRPVASPGPSPPFPRLSTSPAIPGIGAMSDWPTPQVFPDWSRWRRSVPCGRAARRKSESEEELVVEEDSSLESSAFLSSPFRALFRSFSACLLALFLSFFSSLRH